MSYDRQIDQECPHYVAQEPLFVSGDRRTVRPLRPIAAAASVGLWLNGELKVPSYGSLTPAAVTGTKTGPLSLVEDQTTMRVQVDQGAVQPVAVHQGSKIPLQQLVATINLQIRGAQFTVTKDQRIHVETATQGRQAVLRFLSPSPLAEAMGFRVDREHRGLQLAPGWTLIRDKYSLADRPLILLVFDSPLPSTGDFVEVNYTTVRQECRRCGGLGIENDWRYGSTGEVIQVRDEALLLQEVQKIMYTVRGTNPFHKLYGADLLTMVGQKQSMGGILQNRIVADVYRTFANWKDLKTAQEQKVGQIVTDKEFPFRLLSCDVQGSQDDPTVIFVNMTVQNRSFTSIDLSRGIKLPEPIDLMGSTQLSGVIRRSLTESVFVG